MIAFVFSREGAIVALMWSAAFGPIIVHDLYWKWRERRDEERVAGEGPHQR